MQQLAGQSATNPAEGQESWIEDLESNKHES